MTIKTSSKVNVEVEPADGSLAEEFKPMTAEEASQWRSGHKTVSPWRIVMWQLGFSLVLSAVAFLWLGEMIGWSVAYGCGSVILPSAVMVRGLNRQVGVTQPAAVMLGFVVWESAKVFLTIVILVVAPKIIPQVEWLALVVGFIVTMKVYWLAAWLHSRQQSLNNLN